MAENTTATTDPYHIGRGRDLPDVGARVYRMSGPFQVEGEPGEVIDSGRDAYASSVSIEPAGGQIERCYGLARDGVAIGWHLAPEILVGLKVTGVGEGLAGYGRPTYRERREAKAERLREWSEKRAAKATVDLGRGHQMFDAIPFGQPILVGHHSERGDRAYRGRAGAAIDRGLEHQAKAQDFERRADGIESQLKGSIYRDDPDAIEQLEERIAGLEAERDRVKAYNATCRKGARDLGQLDEAQRVQILGLARIGSVFMGKGGAFPGYHLTNLSGNIARNRQRLDGLRRQAAPMAPTVRVVDIETRLEEARRQIAEMGRPG